MIGNGVLRREDTRVDLEMIVNIRRPLGVKGSDKMTISGNSVQAVIGTNNIVSSSRGRCMYAKIYVEHAEEVDKIQFN